MDMAAWTPAEEAAFKVYCKDWAPLEGEKYRTLQAGCKLRGLSARGSWCDLAARLIEDKWRS